tara:strand:- start:1385 stop:2575 length:1191 start_codon:yes stop_codon:yes gene_type:complete
MIDIPSWLLVFPILGILILAHEAAHFITAKWFGAKVEEFGIGFPPRLAGIRIGETIYSINLLPLGGFVKILGEDDPSNPRSLAALTFYKRVIVIVSGSFVNFLLPVFILTGLFMTPHSTLEGGTILITGVAPGSPAEKSGLKAGDHILKIDGSLIRNPSDLVERIKRKAETSIELIVQRGSIVQGISSSPEYSFTETVTVIPRSSPPKLLVVTEVEDPIKEISLRDARKYNVKLEVGSTMTQGALGVMISLINPRFVETSDTIWQAIPNSIEWYKTVLSMTGTAIKEWVSGSGPAPGLGPVGIAHATGEIAESGPSNLFHWMAFISIFLGISNLLPIPPLDGGRLLFILIEKFRNGQSISLQHQSTAIVIGFAVLIMFLALVSYRDIARLLNGEGF